MRRVFRWMSLVSLLAAVAALPGSLHAQEAAGPDEPPPFLTEPETAEETFDAIVKLVDFDRPDLARPYLEKLMRMELTDELLLKLRDKHGPATFLRLANVFTVRPFNGRNYNGWDFRATPALELAPEEDVPREVFGDERWKIGIPALNEDDDGRTFEIIPPERDRGRAALINIAGFDDPKADERPDGFDIYTEQKFGDTVFSCEFMLARGGAAAVYVMGEYKFLILDKYAERRIGESPVAELHNAAIVSVQSKVEPGQWQTLKIRLTAPHVNEDGEKTENARLVEMKLNDRVVRKNWEIKGASPFGLTAAESQTGPILFQGDHGPSAFRKIEITSPLAAELLDRMNAAFAKASTAPARIDALVADLAGSPTEREVAIIQLRSHAMLATPRIIERMGAPQTQADKDLLLYALTRMGSQVVPLLTAALETDNEDLKATLLEALGYLGTRDVVPRLWYPAFDGDQPVGVRAAAMIALSRILKIPTTRVRQVAASGAAAQLARTAREHLAYEHEWDLNENDNVEYWRWSDETKTVAMRELDPRTASLHRGSVYARQAFELSPERTDFQALYLALALASETARVGEDKPLPAGPGTVHDLALTTGVETLSEALRISLKSKNSASTLATLRLLAIVGTKHQILNRPVERAPLLQALNFPDRRVQFAAATTILEIDPSQPFTQSRRVIEILTRALSDGGTPTGMVVDSSIQRGTTIAALLREVGFDPATARTGQDGFSLAASRNDIQLILLEHNTIRWPLSQTVANFQADARTAGIPIAIYGPLSMKHRVRHLLDKYTNVTYIIETVDSGDLDRQLSVFLAETRGPELSDEERTAQMAEAVFWLRHIATGRRTELFDIAPAEAALADAAYDPELASDAILALGAVPTATAQQRLAELTLNSSLAESSRISAALELAFHIQRFGAALKDQKQLAALAAAWKGDDSARVRTALAGVIGSLKPDAKLVGRRLEQLPRPALPESTP